VIAEVNWPSTPAFPHSQATKVSITSQKLELKSKNKIQQTPTFKPLEVKTPKRVSLSWTKWTVAVPEIEVG